MVLDGLALDLEGLRGQVDELVHARDEALLVPLVQVAEARHIQRDHADRAGQLRRAEEAVAALEELAQVQLQTAAHRADHVRVQVRVNEVLEVRQAVLCGHVEEGVDVLTFPVKVGRDVVRRDREREDAAVRVATRHDLDERAVNEVHFPLQLTVGKVDDLVADEGVLVRQVVRARPVESEVREGALAAPARGHVQVVDELLHALHDLLVLHVVQSHEGRHVGVEGRERLGARPFVLKGAEEVDYLAAGRREMLGRGRGDRATHAIEALLDEALERPARAVSGEHVEVVDVVVALAVRRANLRSVDVFEPVVGDDLARRIQDQATQRIPLVCVGVDSPIGAIEVLLDGCNSVDVVSGCGHCSGPVFSALPRVCVSALLQWVLRRGDLCGCGTVCACCCVVIGLCHRVAALRCKGGPPPLHLPPPAGDRPAVRTRDRHVVNTAPLWGAVVALWVMEVFSARCTPPLDLGVRDHGSLDLVFEPNDNHNI